MYEESSFISALSELIGLAILEAMINENTTPIAIITRPAIRSNVVSFVTASNTSLWSIETITVIPLSAKL